jgi:hypothetical protein
MLPEFYSLEWVKEMLAKTHYITHNRDWQTLSKPKVKPGGQEEL